MIRFWLSSESTVNRITRWITRTREEFRITPRNLARVTEGIELPFSEEGKILGAADWWGRVGIQIWPRLSDIQMKMSLKQLRLEL